MAKFQPRKRGTLFFDTSVAGDIVQHVSSLLKDPCLPSETEVVFAVSRWVIEQALKQTGSKIPGNVHFVVLPEPLVSKKRKFKDFPGALRCIKLAEKIAKRYNCCQIYFLQLDTYMAGLFIRLFFPCEFYFSGLFYRPIEHYMSNLDPDISFKERVLSFLKSIILRKFLSTPRLRVIQCFDWYFVNHSKSFKNSNKISYVPDFASLPSSSTRPHCVTDAWLKSENRFLLFGHLNERKGVLKLLESIKRIDSRELARCSFFLCGRVDQKIQKRLDSLIAELAHSGKDKYMHIVDDFLSDDEIWWLINHCHLVLIPYQRHPGSSGVLSWAAAAGKPVLSESFGLVGYEVKKWGLGCAVNTSSPEAIASAFNLLIQHGFGPDVDKIKQREYAAIHSEKNFSKSIISALYYDYDAGYK